MTSDYDPREDEAKEAYRAGRAARREGKSRRETGRAYEIGTRVGIYWQDGWDSENNWINAQGMKSMFNMLRGAAE